MSTTFSILSTIYTTFDEYGLVKKEIYREKDRGKGKRKREKEKRTHRTLP